jgi:hypothetical protein
LGDAKHERGDVAPRERALEGEQLEEDHAEGPHVLLGLRVRVRVRARLRVRLSVGFGFGLRLGLALGPTRPAWA